MEPSRRLEESTELRISSSPARLSFVLGKLRVDLPVALAQQSRLLTDLREVFKADVVEVQVPLALSMPELEAWLACARSVDESQEAGFAVAHDDETLMRALKVHSVPLKQCLRFVSEPCSVVANQGRPRLLLNTRIRPLLNYLLFASTISLDIKYLKELCLL